MTVIFRDALGAVQLTDVKHFQAVDDTVYFDFCSFLFRSFALACPNNITRSAIRQPFSITIF